MKALLLSQKGLVLNKPPLLFVFFGESNSGGIAPNSSATIQELAPRNLKILNNSTLQIEPLDIGTNNLIGHSGLEYAMYNSHGMELELANKYDENFFPNNDVILVKCGQGGSKVSEWTNGSQYWNTMMSRINTIKSILFANNPVNIKVMLSIGINNKGINTPVATYKAGLKDMIQRAKTEIGANISIMKFEFVTNLAISDYNTAISEVASEEGVATFSTNGLTKIADGYHLDYLGMKWACNNFLNSL